MLALLVLGCSSGGQVPEDKSGEAPPVLVDPSALRLPFLVDDYFVPNGCFGDADCQDNAIDINSRACVDRPASAQSVCRRYRYGPLAADMPNFKGFLGILFQDVGPDGEDDIGRVPGLPVEPGAKRVVFWAWVGSDAAPDSVSVSFRAGGANNWDGVNDTINLPYWDDFGVELVVTLTNEIQQFQIDLSGVTYPRGVVSPFGWAIESTGRTEPIDLYIDDVRWE